MNPNRRSLRIKAQTDAIPDPTMMKNNNLYLPEELIVEHILSRLPVKSLLRFCCVSKRWRFIISDPVFAKTHFKMASQQQTPSHKLLLTNLNKLRSLDLEATTSFGMKSCVRKLKNPFKYPMRIGYVVGSINGLLCLEGIDIRHIAKTGCSSFYIWNPSTGFIIKLPEYRSVLPSVHVKYYMYLGFGYASATDDYKVLINPLLVNDEKYCLIFSSRNKCWKKIGDSRLSNWDNNGFRCAVRMGCYSNEALHWVQTKIESDAVKYAILAFDLATEEFRVVPLPMDNDEGVEQHEWAEVLSVILGGRLSITSCEELAGFNWVVTVWVMREYGVQQSWSKLFKIGCRDRSWIFSLCQTTLIAYEENGTIVLKGRTWNSNEIVRFDCKENMSDEVAVTSRWRDMVLVPQEKWNFDNSVVQTGRRYRSGFRDVFRYDESLLKIQL